MFYVWACVCVRMKCIGACLQKITFAVLFNSNHYPSNRFTSVFRHPHLYIKDVEAIFTIYINF